MIIHLIKKFFCVASVVVLMIFCISSFAATGKLSDQLQTITSHERNALKINSLSVSVLLPNKKIPLSFVSGTKTKHDHLPITENTLFKVGSIAKTYTAALVAQAISDGKLNLNDKLGQYLPQYPKWRNITIFQLINQTSGIFDYVDTPNWWRHLTTHHNMVWKSSMLIRLVYSENNVFKPGKGWGYSNTNYILLGVILKKVYGKSADVLMAQLIHQANLQYTFYRTTTLSNELFNRLAHGYVQNRYDETKLNSSWLQTAGAILSTPNDMVIWMYNLFNNHKITGLPITNHFHFINTANGEKASENTAVSYSFGIFRRLTKDGPIYFTPGLISGYVSMMVYAPCLNTYFSYSASKSPIPNFHNIMLSAIMNALVNDTKLKVELSKQHLPAYCAEIKKP